MIHRNSTTVTIRSARVSTTGFVTVPITAASTRKFQLMQEDSVTLSFTLAEAHEFLIGDYIDDELFGRFVLREKQMPAYQKTTGGYEYNLRFDADYWMWENHIFMLTAYTKQNVLFRKECSWQLTEKLREHVKELVRNLDALGFSYNGKPYCIQIHSTAKRAEEVRYVSYDGKHIISALNDMAGQWECEWWVTYGKPSERDFETEGTAPIFESDGSSADITVDRGVIHFGKCERGTALEFSLGDNVESMDISRNTSVYANKIYAVGGTKNIPESYRKTLTFNAHILSEEEQGGGEPPALYFNAGDKRLTGDMTSAENIFAMTYVPANNLYTHPVWTVYLCSTAEKWGIGSRTTSNTKGVWLSRGTYHFEGVLCDIDSKIGWDGLPEEAVLKISVYLSTQGQEENRGTLFSLSKTITSADVRDVYQIDINKTIIVEEGFTAYIVFCVELYCDSEPDDWPNPYSELKDVSNVQVTEIRDYGWLPLIYNDERRWVYFSEGDGVFTMNFCAGYGYSEMAFPPAGFAEGSEFILPYYDGETPGLLVTRIPLSWYLDDLDDPSSLVGFGERRLRMPVTGRFAVRPVITAGGTVETCIKVDDIYPRCYLRVTSVSTVERRTRQEMSDGTTTIWTWQAYVLKAENINGDPFPFHRSFVKPGEKLQALFISEMDEREAYEASYGESGHQPPPIDGDNRPRFLMAGMTFDVAFDGTDMTYTLIRNEDFGASLPNDVLFPKVNDTFVLTGWDVRAMESLGLVEIAENNLKKFVDDYLAAIREDPFTFICDMMSDAFFFGSAGYHVTDGHYVTADGELLFVEYKTNDVYSLPLEGRRVTVYHGALSAPKTSRIIAYEMKLDMPYDTPRYTVGETDAYSRLKMLEKRITQMQ